MIKTRTDFMVVGGGVGGLATALALARKGHSVCVLERATGLSGGAAGALLSPNAVRMLEQLGVGERLRAQAHVPDHYVLRDAIGGGDIFVGEAGEALAARHGAPYLAVYRGDLLDVLHDACRAHPGIDFQWGHRVIDFGETHEGTFVISENGDRFEASGLVGADGTWSRIRARIVGDGDPVISGHITCRALLRRDQVPDALWSPDVIIWCGPDTHLVQYPVKGGELLCVIAAFPGRHYEPGWNALSEPHELDGKFHGQHPAVQGLVSLVDAGRMTVLSDREPVANWTKGCLTLLGDAAHPMLLPIGQSAAMSLEDSVCIAEMVERHPGDVHAAFTAYEQARYLRTGQAQVTARFLDTAFHAAGVVRELRERMVKGSIGALLPTALDWLYAGPADCP